MSTPTYSFWATREQRDRYGQAATAVDKSTRAWINGGVRMWVEAVEAAGMQTTLQLGEDQRYIGVDRVDIPSGERVRVVVGMEPELRERAKAAAAAQGLSLAGALRQALDAASDAVLGPRQAA